MVLKLKNFRGSKLEKGSFRKHKQKLSECCLNTFCARSQMKCQFKFKKGAGALSWSLSVRLALILHNPALDLVFLCRYRKLEQLGQGSKLDLFWAANAICSIDSSLVQRKKVERLFIVLEKVKRHRMVRDPEGSFESVNIRKFYVLVLQGNRIN